MNTYVDVKYLNLMSHRLERFSKKGDNLWNFRCPFCGDSEKNKSKARGYVYRVKVDLFYKCHNCAKGTNLPNLIREVDESLYKEYLFERFRGNDKSEDVIEKFTTRPLFLKGKSPLKSNLIKKISSLSHNHYAKKYVEKRRIPSDKHYLLYHTDSFEKWSNEWCPNKLDDNNDTARLIIPCIDETNKFFACQGRTYDFNSNQLRYQTSKVDKDRQIIFGQDRLKSNQPLYAVEGPIDSLFVDNCVAVLGFNKFKLLSKDYTILPDNDRRNYEVLSNLKQRIEDGYNVVLWPDDIQEKDINDMIMSGMTKEELKTIIHNNTYQGNMALLKFTTWSKRNV